MEELPSHKSIPRKEIDLTMFLQEIEEKNRILVNTKLEKYNIPFDDRAEFTEVTTRHSSFLSFEDRANEIKSKEIDLKKNTLSIVSGLRLNNKLKSNLKKTLFGIERDDGSSCN